MTKTETIMLASYLNLAADMLGDQSCNDMFMVDTPENRALLIGVQLFHYADDKYAYESAEDAATVRTCVIRKGEAPRLSTHNTVVAHYLLNRFMQEHGITKDDLSDPNNW